MALKFAVGADFNAIEEARAHRLLDAAGEVEAAHALARMKLVSRYGMKEAEADRWSPPKLFLFRYGRLSLIYTAKAARGGRAEVLALYFCDMRRARDASPFEKEALRRLEAVGAWS